MCIDWKLGSTKKHFKNSNLIETGRKPMKSLSFPNPKIRLQKRRPKITRKDTEYCFAKRWYKKLLMAIGGILPFLNEPWRVCFLRPWAFESPVDSIVLATTFLNWNLIRRCKLHHCLFLFRGQYFNPRSLAVAIFPRSTVLLSCIIGIWTLASCFEVRGNKDPRFQSVMQINISLSIYIYIYIYMCV